MAVKIFYHDDADGLISAYLWYQANRPFCGPDLPRKAVFEARNYGPNNVLHLGEIGPADHVAILDFSFDNMQEIVDKVLGNGGSFWWFDHHKSAMEKFPALWSSGTIADVPCPFWGFRQIGKAACELVLEHYKHDLTRDFSDVVRLVATIDEHRDNTVFYGNDVIAMIAFGKMIKGMKPDSPALDGIIKAFDLKSLEESGRTIEWAMKLDIVTAITNGFPASIRGHTAFVTNSVTNIQGVLMESLAAGCDIAINVVLRQKGGKPFWQYSLRSMDDGPDVSEIAKAYGGGGHAHAAGFVSDRDPISFLFPDGGRH